LHVIALNLWIDHVVFWDVIYVGSKHVRVVLKYKKTQEFVTSRWKVDDALWDCPFEIHEGIKCDILKFLKVSKVVSNFLKPTFNLLCKICQLVTLWKGRLKVGLKKFNWKFHSYVAFWNSLGHDLIN